MAQHPEKKDGPQQQRVEALAKFLNRHFGQDLLGGRLPWSEVSDYDQDAYRRDASAVLKFLDKRSS